MLSIRSSLLVSSLTLVFWSSVLAAPGSAQGFGPAPVGVTAARSATAAPPLQATGTVVATRTGVVATEVAGLVDRLSVREGDRVKRGAELVRLRSRNLALRLEEARAIRQESVARLAQAERRRTRAQDLFDGGVISQQDLDDAISESDAWSGRVAVSDAEIARLEDDLERTVIRAPYAGAVVAKHIQVGEWLAIGAPVVEMVDLAHLEVIVEVPEQHAVGLRPEQPARIALDALPGLVLEGAVVAVIPRADPTTRTFPVRVRLPAGDERVAAGMLARVTFGEPAADGRVFVPKDAIVRTGPTTAVYVVEETADGAVARFAPVELGTSVGAWVAVSGVEAGASTVTRGNERLAPDSPVVPEPVEYPWP